VLEIGGDQAAEVTAAMAAAGFGPTVVHRDEEGQDRVVVGVFDRNP
jgi:hypothetical protein